jgi:hypothetical protein
MLSADDKPLVGHGRMAEYAASLGIPIAKSTLQKRCSPAINTGPQIVAYFGQRPVTTEKLMREWLTANLRPVGARQ